MGGKHKQRVKDNARPSSSSQSANLLGSTNFFGNAAHTDLGVLPLLTGFSTLKCLPDSLNSNINSEFVPVLRKLNKRDAVTRKKAVEELTNLIDKSDLEECKTLLPIWSEYYQNLAFDLEHLVRESTQIAFKKLMSKCKRSAAPYLKQLVPIWLHSHFDSYKPAAKIAAANFQETFTSSNINRTKEVLLHCQNDIIEYAERNFTLYSHVNLLKKEKNSEIFDENERKFQHAIYGSLKMLSFFINNTYNHNNDTNSIKNAEKIYALFNNQKIWNLTKCNYTLIRIAWFELAYQLVQCSNLENTRTLRQSLLSYSLQAIDDSNCDLAAYAWNCILIIQTNEESWYTMVNFRKTILPKLLNLIRKRFNGNGVIICPKVMNFFSKISSNDLQDMEYSEFCQKFFNDLKEILLQKDYKLTDEADAIGRLYFECMKIIFENMNDDLSDKENLSLNFYLDEHFIPLILWLLNCEGNNVKYYFVRTSMLIRWWLNQKSSDVTVIVLEKLFTKLSTQISIEISEKNVSEIYMQNIFHLINHLYKPEIHKFIEYTPDTYKTKTNSSTVSSKETKKILSNNALDSSKGPNDTDNIAKNKSCGSLNDLKDTIETVTNSSIDSVNCRKDSEKNALTSSILPSKDLKDIHEVSVKSSIDLKVTIEPPLNTSVYSLIALKESTINPTTQKLFISKLKILTTKLIHCCFQNSNFAENKKYIQFVQQTMGLFNEKEFYENLTPEETLEASLNFFKKLLIKSDYSCNDPLIDIIFKILYIVPSTTVTEVIKNQLFGDLEKRKKVLILQYIIEHPLNNDINIQAITEQSELRLLILDIAQEGLHNGNEKNVLLLQKLCFDIKDNKVFDRIVMDNILTMICKVLNTTDNVQQINLCIQFLSKNILILFHNDQNVSAKVKENIFTVMFELSLKYLKLNEDTLWKLTLCDISKYWQDLLKYNLITVTHDIIKSCASAFHKYAHLERKLERNYLKHIVKNLFDLIMNLTNHINNKTDRIAQIDLIFTMLFSSNLNNLELLKDQCTVMEAMNCINSAEIKTESKINLDFFTHIDMLPIFHQALIGFSTILKLNNDLISLSNQLISNVIEYMEIAAIGHSIVHYKLLNGIDNITKDSIALLLKTIEEFFNEESQVLENILENLWLKIKSQKCITTCRCIQFLLYLPKYNPSILLVETLQERLIKQDQQKQSFKEYSYCLQYIIPQLPQRAITMQNSIMEYEIPDIWIKASIYRCLLRNNFNNSSNEFNDKIIIMATLQFITDLIEKKLINNESFTINLISSDKSNIALINMLEYINLLGEILEKFPHQMSLKNWDAVRLGLGSWTLSISKALDKCLNPEILLFIVRVFKLYEKFKNFILIEKQCSSTQKLTVVIEEWENLFAKDVELILFKTFIQLCESPNDSIIACDYYAIVLEKIIPAVELIDIDYIYNAYKDPERLNNLCHFLLKQLSNKTHSIRVCCKRFLCEMTKCCIAIDIVALKKIMDSSITDQLKFPELHFVNIFDNYLNCYGSKICKYLEEFSFKQSEISELCLIDRHDAWSYLLLWDCVIYACSNSPTSLRSAYTSWIEEKKYEETYLHFLFRAMPLEILRNHDTKSLSVDIFQSLSYSQIKDPNMTIEKFACYTYAEILRKLPVMVRKWWSTSSARQKSFVGKLTENFVSPLLCNDELKAIANKKEKDENMQISVRYSTREIFATYSIEDARMELVITLASNYPLGAVKVDCVKQIGGRFSSRNTAMQLSLFLINQNGAICDALAIWKNDLDKKFDGVEECYVCYTVIHQDTCQLPKLTCKTCKKKFHGPCLYKWFTTSSKSTCPICRNVF